MRTPRVRVHRPKVGSDRDIHAKKEGAKSLFSPTCGECKYCGMLFGYLYTGYVCALLRTLDGQYAGRLGMERRADGQIWDVMPDNIVLENCPLADGKVVFYKWALTGKDSKNSIEVREWGDCSDKPRCSCCDHLIGVPEKEYADGMACNFKGLLGCPRKEQYVSSSQWDSDTALKDCPLSGNAILTVRW